MTTLYDTSSPAAPAPEKPKREKPKTTRPPEILTRAEIDALLRTCSTRAKTGIRNRALIVVLWRCGLRISEALALVPKDIDRQAGTVRVLHGKGNKARTIGLDPTAFGVVDRWLDVRSSLGINGRSPVFCTLKGGTIDPGNLRALLPRLARKAGIEKRVHCHGFRHTHAAELAAEGTAMPIIQRQLGHDNLSTTNDYLRNIAPTEVIATMQRRTWTTELL